jgi:hypothetical protein
VRWPAVVVQDPAEPEPFPNSSGFVHVREDRKLSAALEDHFLPVRRYILGRHLCLPPEALVVAGAEQPEVEAALPFEQVPGAGPPNVPSMRFVDALVADFTATAPPSAAAAAPEAAAEERAAAIAQLSPVEQDALRQMVHRAIAAARRVEQNTPGAL